MNIYIRPGGRWEFGPLILCRSDSAEATVWQVVIILPFTGERWAVQFLVSRAA